MKLWSCLRSTINTRHTPGSAFRRGSNNNVEEVNSSKRSHGRRTRHSGGSFYFAEFVLFVLLFFAIVVDVSHAAKDRDQRNETEIIQQTDDQQTDDWFSQPKNKKDEKSTLDAESSNTKHEPWPQPKVNSNDPPWHVVISSSLNPDITAQEATLAPTEATTETTPPSNESIILTKALILGLPELNLLVPSELVLTPAEDVLASAIGQFLTAFLSHRNQNSKSSLFQSVDLRNKVHNNGTVTNIHVSGVARYSLLEVIDAVKPQSLSEATTSTTIDANDLKEIISTYFQFWGLSDLQRYLQGQGVLAKIDESSNLPVGSETMALQISVDGDWIENDKTVGIYAPVRHQHQQQETSANEASSQAMTYLGSGFWAGFIIALGFVVLAVTIGATALILVFRRSHSSSFQVIRTYYCDVESGGSTESAPLEEKSGETRAVSNAKNTTSKDSFNFFGFWTSKSSKSSWANPVRKDISKGRQMASVRGMNNNRTPHVNEITSDYNYCDTNSVMSPDFFSEDDDLLFLQVQTGDSS